MAGIRAFLDFRPARPRLYPFRKNERKNTMNDSNHLTAVKRGLDNWNSRKNAEAADRQAEPNEDDRPAK